jgi:hypothetical protein
MLPAGLLELGASIACSSTCRLQCLLLCYMAISCSRSFVTPCDALNLVLLVNSVVLNRQYVD